MTDVSILNSPELASLNMVLAHELPEGSTILAGGSRGPGDVALVNEQQILNVSLLELGDYRCLRFLERRLRRCFLGTRQGEIRQADRLVF